jgi:hypothetical protein
LPIVDEKAALKVDEQESQRVQNEEEIKPEVADRADTVKESELIN